MIATPSIASLSRPTYSVPDVNRLKRSFPGRHWPSYEEGRRRLQRPEKAKEYFHKAMGFAIKTSKKDAPSFANFMGVDLGEGGHYREALLFFEKALKIDPKYAPAWNNKGAALYNLGRYEEAITCYEKALEIDPNYTQAWNNKGVALNGLGRYEEAITCCDRAMELDPKYASALSNKGWALNDLGRYDEAITCCEKALGLDPKCVGAWNNKGVALYKLGRYKEAIEEYQEALKLNRDLPECHINLAVLLSVTNRHDEVEREFREALRLFKEKKPKKLEEALRYLEKELETHYDSHSLWRAKAEFLKALGRDTEVQQSMERAEVLEGLEIPDIEHDIVVKMLPPIETWRVVKAKVKHLGRATPRVVIDLVED